MTTGTAGESALVMEFADGGPLTADLMRRFMVDDMGKEMAKKVSLGLLAGLEYLHQNKVVHRDLKPDNILLFGTEPIPKISDFGISKVKMCSLTRFAPIIIIHSLKHNFTLKGITAEKKYSRMFCSSTF